ncbi:MAG: glutathione S-transferase family protein [Pseudomonadota bacterium]
MNTLLTFKPALGTDCPSPFGVKAEALLVMSKLPFEKEFGDLLKAPRKKFPVLRNGSDLIPDSAHIQAHLENVHGIDLDAGLDPHQRATATSFRRLIEHHLYFLNMYFRWYEHGEAIKQAFFHDAPALIRGVIFRKVQKNVFNLLHLQGLGRHTRPELIEFARQDLQAISEQLADKPYLLGETASSIDASLYGALHNIIDCDLETPVKGLALAHQNLVDYCARFRQTVLQ